MADRSWFPARDVVKPADLILGAPVQAPLISLLARVGAEPHAPIASGAEPELSAAMVAVERHELRLHVVGDGAQYPIAATAVLRAIL